MKNLLLSAFFAVFCISFCEAQKTASGLQPVIVGKTVRYEQTSEWVLSSSKQDKNKGIDILN
ncbi:MAG: hypothetical protein H7259_01360, partial [Cytophagales bacterium]|nr:hypothetical protein [Cytophaga sp.]